MFTRTKHGANRLAEKLVKDGIAAMAIHGNKSQNARTAALAEFKSGGITALVATDIAARGLDIDQLPQVVNFELPNVPEDYVHRIGRTGRAGATGAAVSLVDREELKLLKDIEKLIKREIPKLPVEGFVAPAKGSEEPDRMQHNQPRGQRPAAKAGQARGQGQRPAMAKDNQPRSSQPQARQAAAKPADQKPGQPYQRKSAPAAGQKKTGSGHSHAAGHPSSPRPSAKPGSHSKPQGALFSAKPVPKAG